MYTHMARIYAGKYSQFTRLAYTIIGGHIQCSCKYTHVLKSLYSDGPELPEVVHSLPDWLEAVGACTLMHML